MKQEEEERGEWAALDRQLRKATPVPLLELMILIGQKLTIHLQ